MGDGKPITDADIEQEIRQGRKFTPEEAIGRLAGPGAMKGASAVSPQQQAENEVSTWLRANLADPAGSLKVVLCRHVIGSALLLETIDRPLAAIDSFCRRVLASDDRLLEIVREADVEWGRSMDERPHFQRDGTPPDPDDPYTLESVRAALGGMLKQLPS